MKRWYLMFTDEDDILRALLGPFIDEHSARGAQGALQAVDAGITAVIDWGAEESLRVPYLYHTIRVIDLDRTEIEALERG